MLNPQDVESIEVVGKLHGDDVKMIKTKGGYHMFVGRRAPHSEESVLTGSSHRAIGLHNLSKNYQNFQQTLKKSEEESLPIVRAMGEKHGYDIYSLEKGEDVLVSACKHGVEVMSLLLKREEDGLYTSAINKDLAQKFNKEEKEKVSDAISHFVKEIK